MVARRSQGNWRWEGPLGTPLGLAHWKRASSRTAQRILTSGTSMGEMTFVKGEGIAALELRNNDTELWATPKTSGLAVFIR